jgi:DNA-binding transcriptional regulator YiaG
MQKKKTKLHNDVKKINSALEDIRKELDSLAEVCESVTETAIALEADIAESERNNKKDPLKFKAARYQAGLSVEQVADALDVNRNTVQRWEKENRVPRRRYFSALCALYERRADEFDLEQPEPKKAGKKEKKNV